jgi:nitric oxide dioxygenase
MLQPRTIEIIKSTVPVLSVHGRAITSRFYQLLFDKHPELFDIFNHVNQKQGRQQTALANAVYAAAANIDRLESILPAVVQIAHKHRSLGVKPEHYPVVGEHLLLAIKDVLGDAATDDILGAWAEAYQVIAGVFISVEREMYERAESQPGGWKDFRPFTVARKVAECDVITSFYLRPADGQPIASFEPGQYVSVKLTLPGEEHTHIRHYSLSDAPDRGHYRISVKREDGGGSPAGKVSTYLHGEIKEGDTLLLGAPAGEFTLDRRGERPVVLLSGGVGLTPLLSMLGALVSEKPPRPVTFIHAARNGRSHAMAGTLAAVAKEHPQVKTHVVYSAPTEEDRARGAFQKEGRIDLAWLETVLPSRDADFYFCGPVPFMSTVNRALVAWGVPEERIHFEFFGPAGDMDAAAPAS